MIAKHFEWVTSISVSAKSHCKFEAENHSTKLKKKSKQPDRWRYDAADIADSRHHANCHMLTNVTGWI